MYSYYLLASLGPRMRPYLWWKRYLTQLQLTQFAIILFFALLIQVTAMLFTMALLIHLTSYLYSFQLARWSKESKKPKELERTRMPVK